MNPIVHVLEMRRGPMKNYNYVVVDTMSRSAIIVDPAWEMDKIQTTIDKLGVRLKAVLITHTHHDHINLAKQVAEKYGCPIMMSEEEIVYSGFHHRSLQPLDGTPVFIDYLKIDPILTPGHTPGCVCYLIGNNFFTGDVLFSEGCGICPDNEAASEMYHSLSFIKENLNPATLIYPGHSYGKKVGQMFCDVLRDNLYLNIEELNSFVGFRMRRGQNRMMDFA